MDSKVRYKVQYKTVDKKKKHNLLQSLGKRLFLFFIFYFTLFPLYLFAVISLQCQRWTTLQGPSVPGAPEFPFFSHTSPAHLSLNVTPCVEKPELREPCQDRKMGQSRVLSGAERFIKSMSIYSSSSSGKGWLCLSGGVGFLTSPLKCFNFFVEFNSNKRKMERRASISTHLSFQKDTVYQTIHTKIFIVKLLNTITSFKSVEQLEVFRSTSVCHGSAWFTT